MSNNRKNNHYHYAEKYAVKRNHSRSGRSVYVPFKAVIASLVVLLMFGLVSTTFGAYITESEPEYNPEKPGIISEVRNIKNTRDVALTGARHDLAETGDGWMTMNGGGYFIFDNTNSGWSDVQMLVGRRYNYGSDGVFCRKYNMTQITGTNLYALQISNWSTSGDGTHIYDIVFVTGTSSWGADENTSPVDRRTYATNYSAVYSNSGASFTSTGVYACSLSSGSNNATVTISTITSTGYSYYNYNQTAYAYYKSGTGSYTKGTTGGTVSVDSGVRLNGNTSSTDASISDSSGTYTINAAKTSTLTLKATAAANYRFVGWFTSTSATTATSTSSTISFTVTQANTATYYARFIRTYTVSIAKATASGTTGTFSGTPTFTYNGSNSTSATVDVGSSITLNSANTNSGINCTFHLSSATGTTITSPYTITAAGSIYAVYSMTAPTISAFSYAGSPTTVGASAISPSKTVSAGASGTLSYAYSFVSTGSTSTSGYTLNSSSGAFSATVPGKYVIRLTVTETASGLTRTATSDTTITVKPTAPDATLLQYTVEGYTDDYTHGTTGKSYNLPIKVPINSESFKITAWLSSVTSGYTYNWSNVTGNYNTTNGSITAISGAVTRTATDTRIVDLCTDSATALRVSADGNYAYQIRVTANINDVESDPTTLVLYYDVISDFLDIQYMSFTQNTNDYQKIYAEDNDIDNIVSTIRAGGTTFNTIFWFSPNNINFAVQELWGANFPIDNSYGNFTDPVPDDATHRTSALQTSFDVSNLMAVTGPKWFRIYMNDTGNQKTASATRIIHTTVGTSSSSADRPIYYVDNTNHSYLDTRVMAFYVLEGETAVHYQTAQTATSGRYRFYVPSNAKYIVFAHVASDSYVLPTFSNSTFSMTADSNYLKAWTETVDLTSSSNVNKNVYTATSATLASGIYNYTGSMGVLN